MAKRRFSPEWIISYLWPGEIFVSQGKTAGAGQKTSCLVGSLIAPARGQRRRKAAGRHNGTRARMRARRLLKGADRVRPGNPQTASAPQ
jgi:hypothetical protein